MRYSQNLILNRVRNVRGTLGVPGPTPSPPPPRTLSPLPWQRRHPLALQRCWRVISAYQLPRASINKAAILVYISSSPHKITAYNCDLQVHLGGRGGYSNFYPRSLDGCERSGRDSSADVLLIQVSVMKCECLEFPSKTPTTLFFNSLRRISKNEEE